MIERVARIVNSLGMHARPAAQVVRAVTPFKAEVHLQHDGMSVNAKSIMGVMMLAAECGAEVKVRGEGEEAEAAVTALCDLIARGFGET